MFVLSQERIGETWPLPAPSRLRSKRRDCNQHQTKEQSPQANPPRPFTHIERRDFITGRVTGISYGPGYGLPVPLTKRNHEQSPIAQLSPTPLALPPPH